MYNVVEHLKEEILLFNRNSAPADVIKVYPQASDLFKKNHINFCCSGERTIEEQCRELSIDAETIVEELNNRYSTWKEEEKDVKNWDKVSIEEIIEEIASKYHPFFRNELDALNEYVTRVNHVHGAEQPHLTKLYNLYHMLLEKIKAHIYEEERDFIPLLSGDSTSLENINNIKQKLETNHEEIYQLLNDIRKITNNFEAPTYACGTYRVAYDRLEQLESKTYEYIHLENNVLFKRM